MKFSEQWLRDWVNPPISTAELAEQLTMAGLEVEALEPVAGDFTQVVVGEVLAVEPHPDADRLRVCQVQVQAKTRLTIVCGAANVTPGVRVPTALVGAQLPGGLHIKQAKLRGVESFGMLCSAKELGLAETAQGLMILPADTPIGADVRDYLKLDDRSITLGLTPNRGDCLSVRGVAREVAVRNNMKIKSLSFHEIKPQTSESLEIKIEAPQDCPRYVGRVIKGINPQAHTPLWMQERLRRSGLRSISPVVDVTNYVLLELGQPMHAFDLDRLSGGIIVRKAKAGEQLTLLDGKALALTDAPLVIADQRQPLALAGIMGGEDSAVSAHTRNIFLESAFFTPEAISGRARQYGLHTDSSHRFERGVDPQLALLAMHRASELLVEIVGGQAGPIKEQISPSHLPQRPAITLRPERVQRLLGVAINAEQVLDILTRLDMEVKAQGGQWQVTPPSHRFDIAIEADLIEEIARVYGYSQIPSRQAKAPLMIKPQAEAVIGDGWLRRIMVDRGYQEVVTYSFVDPQLQAQLTPEEPGIALANPIASNMAVMRTTLWSGLLPAVAYNQNRQHARIRLFEIGPRYRGTLAERREEKVLAGVACGAVWPEQWGLPSREVDFFDVKSDIEALVNLSERSSRLHYKRGQHPALHPGQSCQIQTAEGRVLGWLGAIHPGLLTSLGLVGPVLVFELDAQGLSQASLPHYQGISRFPSVRRDLALVVAEEVTAEMIAACIQEVAGDLLQDLQLFDVYRGKGIDSGKKSLALGLTFQETSRTLRDDEVEVLIKQVVGQLVDRFGAALRE